MITPLSVSVSEYNALRKCPRLYQYTYVQNRKPARPSHELTWGGALHRGLEGAMWCRKHGLTEYVEPWALVCALSSADEGPPHDPYALAGLKAVLRAYLAYWGPSDARRYEVVAVEQSYRIPIFGPKGKLSSDLFHDGKVDAIVRESGRVLVMEHKTTGKEPQSERYIEGIELDLQIAAYLGAMRFAHYPIVEGVLYDIIRRPDYHDPKPEPKRKPKDEVVYSNPRFGETADEYEQRVYTLALSRPKEWFCRREITLTPKQVQDARANLRAAALEIRWRERNNLYPMVADRHVCAQYYSPCPFRGVCNGTESIDDERLFKVRK